MKREHNITTETPLPSGYTRLNYIESTGNQYINTGYYVGNKKTRIVAEIAKTNSLADNTSLFSASSPSDNQWFCIPYFYQNYLHSAAMYIGGYAIITAIPVTVNTIIDFDITVDVPNNNLSYDIECGSCRTQGDVSGLVGVYNAPLYLFCGAKYTTIQNKTKAKFYSFIIYENDALVHNYIPALRDLDSKPGLYDVAAGEFKVNQGTGEFLYA